MKIILILLCTSVLVVTIGTAPAVEIGDKNARQGDPKDGKQSDDDVVPIFIFPIDILYIYHLIFF